MVTAVAGTAADRAGDGWVAGTVVSIATARAAGSTPREYYVHIHSRRSILQHVDRNSQARRLVITGVILMSSIAMANLPGPARAADAAAPAGTAAQTTKSGPNAATGVDGLIAHLHEVFKITPAQESLFQKLADVMREDADTMSALAKKRADDAKTMTAVDDLKSYSEISGAHAEGTKKMIPVFQALYDSMSDAQKKAADVEFREHYAAHHHRKH